MLRCANFTITDFFYKYSHAHVVAGTPLQHYSLCVNIKDLFKRTQQEPVIEGYVVERRYPAQYTPGALQDDAGVLPGLNANDVRARALMPYKRLSKDEQEEWVDTRILSMMVAAENLMMRNGDVWEALNAQIDLGVGPLIVSHPDKGVEKAYRDMFSRIAIDYILEDAWLTRGEYGNAYTLVMGDNESNFSVVNLNPKHVAVGQQLQVGTRPINFFPNSRNPKDLNDQFYHERVLDTSRWNEWKDHSSGGLPLDGARVYHSHPRKPHHRRYAYPPVILAYDNITTRMIVAELVRSTAEGLKTQIRLWRLDKPVRGEIGQLVSQIRSMRADRTYDLFWKNNLEVEQIIPGTIDELLANETWLRLTNSIFRDMGMFLRLVSGESPGDKGTDKGVQVEVNIALSRLKAEQRLSMQIARWVADRYARYGDKSLASKDAPAIRMGESVLSSSVLINEVYVPLMNYGIVSIRTVHESLGMDYETEIARLEEEADLRESIILPYTSFKQTVTDAGGNTRTVEHQQSQGRPRGKDLDPNNRRQNERNRNQGS